MSFDLSGRHVLVSRQKNSGVRPNAADGRRLMQHLQIPWLWASLLQMIANRRCWTSIHTSSMYSVIIPLRLNFLGPWIHFLLSWFVNSSSVCMEQLLELYWQGELEHRTSKSHYACTSHKTFLPQLASIERFVFMPREKHGKGTTQPKTCQTSTILLEGHKTFLKISVFLCKRTWMTQLLKWVCQHKLMSTS